MSRIQYNAWEDAANYGKGLGDVLSRVILELPQLRAQQRLAAQQAPIQAQMQQAQLGEAQARTQLLQAQASGLPQENEARNQTALAAIMRAQNDQQQIPLQTEHLQAQNDLLRAQTQHAQNGGDLIPANIVAHRNQLVHQLDTITAAMGKLDMTSPANLMPQFQTMQGQLQQQIGEKDALLGQLTRVFANQRGLTNGAPTMQSSPIMSSPSSATPITATNPTTGQRLQLINGQWTPIQ